MQGGVWVDQLRVSYRRFGGLLALGMGESLRLSLGLRVEGVYAQLPKGGEALIANGAGEVEHAAFDFQLLEDNALLFQLFSGLSWDSRDDPAFPTRGMRLAAFAQGGFYDGPYGGGQISLEHYSRLLSQHLFRFDIEAGFILGGAPFFEHFFVGDWHPYIPERALGLNFGRRRGPKLLDQGIERQRYESFAARLGGEYRIPLGESEPYRTEFFLGAALLSLGSAGEERALDAAIDLGLRIESEIGVMGLSLSNTLLLVDP